MTHTAKRRWAFVGLAVCCLLWPVESRAQRSLHWDALVVEAHLDAQGVLHVAERQTMVFTGDWNGGERRFDIRPRQTISDITMERIDASGARHPLTEDRTLDDVDDFADVGDATVRWRSRRPNDPPFDETRITYVLNYRLGNIVQTDGTSYTLDHDFAFADRDGVIERVEVRLTLDPVWQPEAPLQQQWVGGPLSPGDGFVLTIPLRFTGDVAPAVLDTRRPPEIVLAVNVLLAGAAIAVVLFFLREEAVGRFARLPDVDSDGEWLQRDVLGRPAELVGALWDESVGSPEVVALLARLEAEGKLESSVKRGSMTLQLLSPREEFGEYERKLIDGLFFSPELTVTSTGALKKHYKQKGFDPAELIRPGLETSMSEVMSGARGAALWSWLAALLLIAGTGLLIRALMAGEEVVGLVFVFIGALGAAGLLQIPGVFFRRRMDWGRLMALVWLVPVLAAVGVVIAFLWYVAGTERVVLSPYFLAAIVALALWVAQTGVNALASRRGAAGIALRKRLTAARKHFARELDTPSPRLRDEWYPWLLAFGLGKHADQWSERFGPSRTASRRSRDDSVSTTWSTSSSSSGTSTSGWTGAAGGRSGGAGGGAAWTTAAAGIAAGVSPPSSSSSGGSSSSSSSGGSSVGGGGGGW